MLSHYNIQQTSNKNTSFGQRFALNRVKENLKLNLVYQQASPNIFIHSCLIQYVLSPYYAPCILPVTVDMQI